MLCADDPDSLLASCHDHPSQTDTGVQIRRHTTKETTLMQIARLSDAPAYNDEHLVAHRLLEAEHCNVRFIRLSPGQAVPPHAHSGSDLMLLAFEGSGHLDTPDGEVPFEAGSMAHITSDEKLSVRNTGDSGMTLFAVLSPAFPARKSD